MATPVATTDPALKATSWLGRAGWFFGSMVVCFVCASAITVVLALGFIWLAGDQDMGMSFILVIAQAWVTVPLGYLSGLLVADRFATKRQKTAPNRQVRASLAGSLTPIAILGLLVLARAMSESAADYSDRSDDVVRTVLADVTSRPSVSGTKYGSGIAACLGQDVSFLRSPERYSHSRGTAEIDPSTVGTFLSETSEDLEREGWTIAQLEDREDALWQLYAVRQDELLSIRGKPGEFAGSLAVAAYVGPCIEREGAALFNGSLADQAMVPGWTAETIQPTSNLTAGLTEVFALTDPEGWWGSYEVPSRTTGWTGCSDEVVVTPNSSMSRRSEGTTEEQLTFDWYKGRVADFQAAGWEVTTTRLVFVEADGPDTERWLIWASRDNYGVSLTATFTYWPQTDEYAASVARSVYIADCIRTAGADLATTAPWYDERLVMPDLDELPDLDD